MKTSVTSNMGIYSRIKTSIAAVAACGVFLAATNVTLGQTTYEWTGLAGDFRLGSANNWTPNNTPSGGASDIMQWDATAATGNLLVTNASALDTSPGLNLNITSDHTGSLTIVGTGPRLRLNTNSLTIANGAGAFNFGYGSPTVAFPVALAGVGNGAVHAWTNDSTSTATLWSELNFVMGGGGGHTLLLAGTGNWNVYSQLQAQNSGAGLALTVAGSGTVLYAPTNAPSTTFSGTFNGMTINSGTLKLGNGSAVPATITINGGTLDLNGFSLTNNLNGAGSIDTTAVGGTPTLTISNNNNTTINGAIKNSQGTLTLVKRGAGTITMNGTNTYSGSTTIGSGTVILNGKLGAGDVTVSNAASFGGSGSVGGNVTWQTGATVILGVTNNGVGNGTVFTLGGTANLNNNNVTINVAGNTPLPVGTYTLLSAGAINGTFVPQLNFSGAGVASGTGSSVAINGTSAILSVTNLGTNSTWITDLGNGSGNWSTAASWQNNVVPGNPGDVATLGVGSALGTVNLDVNASLGGLNLTNANSFIIGNAGKTLTFDDIGTGVAIFVNNGSNNAIATAVSLNDKVTANINAPNQLTISGNISGTGANNTLTKINNGTLVLSGNNSYGPATAGSIGTIISGGTLELGNALALGAGDVTNTANTTWRIDSSMTLANKIGIAAGNTINLDDTGKNISLTGGLAGNGSINKIGTGKETLSGGGTLGTLTLSTNGTLEIASGTYAANGQLFVDSSSTLQIDNGAALNFLASGFGFIGNTTGLTATNIINGGSLNYSNANFVVGRNGPGVLILNGGVFSCNNFFDGQTTTGEPANVFLNGGTLLVNNIQSQGNAGNLFYFNGGAVAARVASTTFWANNSLVTVYVRNNPGIISNGGFNITIAQPFFSETGTDGGMIFNGSGVTTLTSANGYNGPTVVTGGTLLNNGTISSSTVTVQSGASFGGVGYTSGNTIWQPGSTATLVVSNSSGGNLSPFTVAGTITANNNTVIVNVPGNNPLPVGTYNLLNSSGITGSFASTATFTGAGISAGTVGTITSDGFSLQLTVAVGGNTWSHDGNGNWSTAANWSGNPAIPGAPGDSAVLGVGSSFTTVSLDTNISLGALTFSNLNSFAVADTGKTLTMTNGAGNVGVNIFGGTSNSIGAAVVLNGPVSVSGGSGSALQITNNVSGPGNLTMTGDGTGSLTLSGSNTYVGGTTISAGALVLGSTNAIGTNVLRINGGALDSAVTNLVMRGNNQQQWFGNFSFLGSNNLSMGNSAINVSNAVTVSITNKLVIPGRINAGTLALTFIGNGTLELDSSNTIGTVNSGVSVLYFGTNVAAGSGVLNAYSANAAFASATTNALTIHNQLGTANGANGWTFVGAGNLTFDGGVTSYNFNKFAAVSNAVTTWNFALPGGAASTTKIGPGTLVLSGANLNTGGNVVQEGTLALANAGALGVGGALVMNGGNLDSLTVNLTNVNVNPQTWNTNFTFLGSQNLNLGLGDVTIATNGMVVTVNANTLAIGGALNDGSLGYPLTVAGAGTLALGGNNTYSGDTTIAGGSLRIESAGTLNGGAYSGNITNNGTFNYGSSAAQTLSGIISGTGSLIKSGTGLLTLSGVNTYTGNTTVTAGTLELVNPALSTNGTVTIGSGSTIQLDFAGINKVKSLVLNGAVQPVGIYNSSTPGGFISGSGSLQVLSAGPSGSAIITNSVSGTTLTLSWPAGQGWRLQMQTNGLTNPNWVYVTDGSVNSTNITMNPAVPTTFYRLAYP